MVISYILQISLGAVVLTATADQPDQASTSLAWTAEQDAITCSRVILQYSIGGLVQTTASDNCKDYPEAENENVFVQN